MYKFSSKEEFEEYYKEIFPELAKAIIDGLYVFEEVSLHCTAYCDRCEYNRRIRQTVLYDICNHDLGYSSVPFKDFNAEYIQEISKRFPEYCI